MLSDLAILTEEAVKSRDFNAEDVKAFIASRVATREGNHLTKSDVTVARIHFLGEKPKAGSRALKRSAGDVSDGPESAGKRVRMNDDHNPQESPAHVASIVGHSRVVWQYSYLTKPQYDDNAHLQDAATNFRQHLLSHVQDVNRQRVKKRDEFNKLENSFEQQTALHQEQLRLRSIAQDAVRSSQEKLENLRADSEGLASFECLLHDSVDQSMNAPSEPAVALQNELWDHTAAIEIRDQTAANARDVNEAEAELQSARLGLKRTEDALNLVFPAYERATKDRLNELEAATNKLRDQTRHAEFMRVIVENGPSAFATIEKALAEKNITLGDIIAKIPTANSASSPAGFE
jgi:membrane-associated HD superfamily phosphohydrolase